MLILYQWRNGFFRMGLDVMRGPGVWTIGLSWGNLLRLNPNREPKIGYINYADNVDLIFEKGRWPRVWRYHMRQRDVI